jgi:hypothetical protein
MPRARLVVVLSVVAFLLAGAPPGAFAESGCQAPPGTAAVEQYCDTLPAVGGPSDPTGTIRRRLASVLPKPLVHRLDQAGVLGEVLLALPAADSASRALPTVNGRRARFRPGVAPLLPGPAMTARSLSDGAATSSWVSGGLGWVLVATMFSLALISLWGHLRPE